jgi:hypothetical protein
MLALQLHLLNEVLLKLASIEWIGRTFCWWDATLGSSLIITVNLFYHYHH